MDYHTVLRCRCVTRDLPCCPDRGNWLQSTVPCVCHTPWAYLCLWSRETLETGLPASTPVIVSPGRARLLLQQQWQVFKETAVYTRMFYTAKQKIFLPVPPGFRQKQQTLNQQASRAPRERQLPCAACARKLQGEKNYVGAAPLWRIPRGFMLMT